MGAALRANAGQPAAGVYRSQRGSRFCSLLPFFKRDPMTHDMKRLTPADELDALVPLEKAKAHLRVSHVLEDDLIKSYLAGLADELDGYSGSLGRALREQQWQLTISEAPCSGVIRLPLVPFVAIDEIAFDDAAGDEQIADPGDYRVRRDQGFGVIEAAYGKSLPWASAQEIRVTYTVGYTDDDPMPANIFNAILLMLGDIYTHRSAGVEGRVMTVNPTVERLLAPFRVRSW